jgi:hypothetical protein
VLQQLAAAPADALRDLWRLLFVNLAWSVDAAEKIRQGSLAAAAAAAATGGSSRRRGRGRGSSSSCVVTQFLAAAGAPAAAPQPDFKQDALDEAMMLMQQLVLAKVKVIEELVRAGYELPASEQNRSNDTATSSGSSSISGNASVGQQQQQEPTCLLLQQLVEALPFPEVLLLLQEQLLLDPSCLSCEPLIVLVLNLLLDVVGQAAGAEAAAALLPPLLAQLPAAVLRAAAAAGCPGCRLGAAASTEDVALVSEMHTQYVLLVDSVIVFASAAFEGKHVADCCVASSWLAGSGSAIKMWTAITGSARRAVSGSLHAQQHSEGFSPSWR